VILDNISTSCSVVGLCSLSDGKGKQGTTGLVERPTTRGRRASDDFNVQNLPKMPTRIET